MKTLKELPENIRQAFDLIAAVLRRIKEDHEKRGIPLNTIQNNMKGAPAV